MQYRTKKSDRYHPVFSKVVPIGSPNRDKTDYLLIMVIPEGAIPVCS